jgi:signal transduction histidine kinase
MVQGGLGLVPAIEWVVQNFTHRTGIPCGLDIDEALELDEPFATGVFRMVQESLANVGKHAKARQAQVYLHPRRGMLVLRVVDDGVGFRTGDPRKPQSLGLVGLRERAQLMRGELRVESSPGTGTRIEAQIPITDGAA